MRSTPGETSAGTADTKTAGTSTAHGSRRPRWIGPLWLLAGASTWWSFGYTEMMGSDLWWHVASGRFILAHPQFPLRDPWSFTRLGEPWLHHEWLADVGYCLWAERWGLDSLVYWKWGLVVAIFALHFRHLASRSGRPAATGACCCRSCSWSGPTCTAASRSAWQRSLGCC